MSRFFTALRNLESKWQFFVLLYAGLALTHVVDLHEFVRRSQDFKRWHHWHDLILQGRAYYPDQYRPLTNWIVEGVYRVWLSGHWLHRVTTFEYSNLLVRFVFILIAFFLLHLFLRRWFSSPACAAAVIFVAAVLPLTVIRCSTCITDPLNFLIFIIGYWLIRDDKRWWLPPLLMVGMLNREVSALLIIVYVSMNYDLPFRKWFPAACAMVASVLIAYFGVRLYYGPRPAWAPTSASFYFRDNFLEWRTWQAVFTFLGAWVFWFWKGLKSKPLFLRRCLWMLPIYFIGHATNAYLREVRFWLPMLPILIPLAMWSIWGPEKAKDC